MHSCLSAFPFVCVYFVEPYPCVESHPRVCGKYLCRTLKYFLNQGSPPRVREVCHAAIYLGDDMGITPAYAGSIRLGHRCVHTRQDHPRVCGKYNLSKTWNLPTPGSPPRMREVLDTFKLITPYLRITPAYAGSILKAFEYTLTD